MRIALFCLVLATAAVCGSAMSPLSDSTIRDIESAISTVAHDNHPAVSAVRKTFAPMTVDCSQGTLCYQCALAMVDAVKPYQDAQCASSPTFSSENTQTARETYCTSPCYRAAVKLFRVFSVDPCLSYIQSTTSGLSSLSFGSFSALLEYACVKNPVDGSYCSVSLATLGTGSGLSFVGGANSTGCNAFADLGCCWQSTLEMMNNTVLGLYKYGITLSNINNVYQNLCQLQGTPACPVYGVATTQIKGTFVIRNLLYSYISAATRTFVRRTIARAIYQSIIAQNANLPITEASVQVTGFTNKPSLLSTGFELSTVNSGVAVDFYVESPSDSVSTSSLLTPVQNAFVVFVTSSLSDLPSAAKVDTAQSFAADPSLSSASAQTTQDFSPAAALVPTSLSLILGVVGLVAAVMH